MAAPSRAAGGPDRQHAGLLDGVEFRPVFIMGNARSGTTILYRLLALSERFNTATAYHLICYDQLLANHLGGRTEQAKARLQEMLQGLDIDGSRFDRVSISPDFPEEYGFALTKGWSQRLAPARLPRFVELCRKIQVLAAENRPLLLKNPWDYGNFLYVKEAFPASRFIFIHRDPLRIMSSLLRSMRSLLERRNAYHALLAPAYDRLTRSPIRLRLARLLFTPRLGLGVRVVGRQVARAARYFVRNVERLEGADYICLRYEDLCRDPRRVVDGVLDFLGLETNPAVDYARHVRPSRAPLPEEVRARRESLLRRLALDPYLAYCGYRRNGTDDFTIEPREEPPWGRPLTPQRRRPALAGSGATADAGAAGSR